MENRGWTANGILTNAGRMHYYLSAPPTWIKIGGNGSIAIDPAFFLAPSVVGNDDPNNPGQKRINRLCQQLLLHDSVLRDEEAATADSATRNDIAKSHSNFIEKYDQYYTHPHDTLEPDPRQSADSTYKNSFDFRAAEVAKAAEQLSRFIPTRAGLSHAPNARHIRPSQPSPIYGPIVITPPSQPLQNKTADTDSRQSGEGNRTPDELKFPPLPSVTRFTGLPQPQDHPKQSMAGPSGTSSRSFVGDMQYPTEISESNPGGRRDRILGQLSQLKAKFTRGERKAGR